MDKLTRSDITGMPAYESRRDELRRQVIEHKRTRRVALGPLVSVVFEDRLTLRFQIEEMLRAENIRDDDRVRRELAAYNELVPDAGELSATIFVEVERAAELPAILRRLVGIDEHLALVLGQRRVPARFEPGRQEAERIASVQYVRFPVGAAPELADPAVEIALEATHPDYRARTVLDPATRASLARDLA